jgi:hypothetical protein
MAEGVLLKAARVQDQRGCRSRLSRPPVAPLECSSRGRLPTRPAGVASRRVDADRLAAKTERLSQAVGDVRESARSSRDHGRGNLRARRLSGFAACEFGGGRLGWKRGLLRKCEQEARDWKAWSSRTASVMAREGAALVAARLASTRRTRP